MVNTHTTNVSLLQSSGRRDRKRFLKRWPRCLISSAPTLVSLFLSSSSSWGFHSAIFPGDEWINKHVIRSACTFKHIHIVYRVSLKIVTTFPLSAYGKVVTIFRLTLYTNDLSLTRFLIIHDNRIANFNQSSVRSTRRFRPGRSGTVTIHGPHSISRTP